MKSRKSIFISAIFLFIAHTFVFSQNSKSTFQIANDYFDNGDYINAVTYYEKNLPDDKSIYENPFVFCLSSQLSSHIQYRI